MQGNQREKYKIQGYRRANSEERHGTICGHSRARITVLALRGPHQLRETFRVHSLWWSNHLDLHRGWGRRRQFLKQTLTSPMEHGRPPDGRTLAYKNFADVNIPPHDAEETRGTRWLLYQSNLAGKTLPRNGKVGRRQ